MRSFMRFRQAGFTLVEIMVIAPIVILAIGAFVTVIISMTGEVLTSRGSNILAYNIQDATNRIEQDVRLSTTYLAQNNITLTAGEAQGYNNDATNFTNVGGTSGTSLILSMLVTNDNPLSNTNSVVYLANQPNACASTQVRENAPMVMNVVYFVKDNTLWRRTIMPSNYATPGVGCSTPWQQPSCAPGYTAVFCKTNDIKLVEGVSGTGFNVQYFGAASATSPNATVSNPATSIDDRNTALASLPTVSVSISASQSIAGRTVERAATLRASRLETNASTIAKPLVETAPSVPAPVGSYTYSAPNSVTFTWPQSTGNNVLYTLDYNVDGGSWQSGLSNSTQRTFTAAAGYNNATVNVRVRASNSAGTSSYGTTSYGVPIWIPPTLQNGWRNYDAAFNKPGFTKTSSGIVMLRGLIAGGTASPGANIFQLPDDYCPPYNLTFETITNASVFSRVYINSAACTVYVTKADTGYLTLDGIYFPVGGAVSFTNTTPFYNSWTNYITAYGGPYAPVSYGTDNLGRVHLRGLAANGTLTNGTRITGLPTPLLPPTGEVSILPSESGSYAAFQLDGRTGGSPGIQAGYGGVTYLSVQAMYYPSPLSGWTALTLQNSWAYYGVPFPTAKYRKGADGIVTLTGLIKSGSTTANAVIATLPPGYRPSSGTAIFGIPSGNVAMGRVDIDTDGNIKYLAGGNAWLSLDGIHFIGE